MPSKKVPCIGGCGRESRVGRCKSCAKKQPVEQRFWKKVNKNGPTISYVGTPCWVWTGAKDDYGYGTFFYLAKTEKAHRASYMMHCGEIPNELWVLHKCDNPPCVNPNHLWLGTRIDNVQDMEKKGRADHPGGDRHGFRTKPESRPTGERNGAYTKPESRRTGIKNGRARLTDNQVIELRELRKQGATYKQLMERFNIGQTTVSHIVNYDNWKHL